MLDLSCTNEQKIKVTAVPKTATGRPAQIDGALTATVISGDGTAEQVPGDNFSVFLISADTPGDTTYLIEADADLGSGIVAVQDTATLHVAGALAANLGLVAGTPEPK